MQNLISILTPTVIATSTVSAGLALILLVALPRAVNDFDLRCMKIIAKIRPQRCNPLSEALDDYSVTNDGEFYESIHGLLGLFEALQQVRHHLALTQLHFYGRRISLEDASFMWRNTALQLWFTLWAIPEALVCRVIPGYPHACAFMAANFHRAEMLRLVTACVTERAPSYMLKFGENL